MDADQLRDRQSPLKQHYRQQPSAARVLFESTGAIDVDDLTCRLDTPAGEVSSGLHPAAGGDGSSACSGDMLLQALVACSGVTFAAVATALSIPIRSARVTAAAELDFRGTLAVDKETPVAFQSVRLQFVIDSSAEEADLDKLVRLAERYCVVLQTLANPAQLSCSWQRR